MEVTSFVTGLKEQQHYMNDHRHGENRYKSPDVMYIKSGTHKQSTLSVANILKTEQTNKIPIEYLAIIHHYM
jgi:hypothetical protein